MIDNKRLEALVIFNSAGAYDQFDESEIRQLEAWKILNVSSDPSHEDTLRVAFAIYSTLWLRGIAMKDLGIMQQSCTALDAVSRIWHVTLGEAHKKTIQRGDTLYWQQQALDGSPKVDKDSCIMNFGISKV